MNDAERHRGPRPPDPGDDGAAPRHPPTLSRNQPRHTVLVVSDGTGITGERVVQAVMTQFDQPLVQVERISEVRDEIRTREAVEEAARRGATLLFSLVSPSQRRVLIHEARRLHVTTIDLLGPILQRLSEVLHALPRSVPGLFHHLDEDYLRRIDAINFAVKHDDGQATADLESADLVVVGVSRTTKTPLSMYLAYRGWKVANVPMILGIEPPPQLLKLPKERVLGLSAAAPWLAEIRAERERRIAGGRVTTYSEAEHIRRELIWFRDLASKRGWTVIDVTRKAIEETASEIVALLRR